MNEIDWCINYLKEYNHIICNLGDTKENQFRALMNITMPYDLSDEYYEKEEKVLKSILSRKTITDIIGFNNCISIAKGDITLFKVDAIVNACNSKLLGCFQPLHKCVDNAIHSFAGLKVRRDLMRIMDNQGHDEANGLCKVTKGYNLPSKYIFHTVGPIYNNLKQDAIDLRNSYYNSLKMADDMKLESIAFPSISTGIFGYPIEKASEIAINTAKEYLEKENKNLKKIVFVLFSEGDYSVYERKINKAY